MVTQRADSITISIEKQDDLSNVSDDYYLQIIFGKSTMKLPKDELLEVTKVFNLLSDLILTLSLKDSVELSEIKRKIYLNYVYPKFKL